MRLGEAVAALAAWTIHHIFGFAILIKDGCLLARDYLRDQIYGWPAEEED